MQDSWKQLKSDSISWRKTLKNSHNSQIQWPVVSTPCQETTNQLTRKVDSREHQDWTRIRSRNQLVTYKVNMEWKTELNLCIKTIVTRGSEFLVAWTNWSQTWSTRSTTTTSRRPLQRRRKYLRLQADPRLKQNQEDLQLLAHLQGLFLFLKEYGLILNRSSIRSNSPSGKKKKHSSSTRRITSRSRWSDRILEIERWSSEQIWVLSILVWWCMEKQDGRRRRQQENISILYSPVRTRNSLPSSSSRSFRTQSHWSFTTGQCRVSGRFLRVHLSYWMCGQLTLNHKFRIDSGRTKF